VLDIGRVNAERNDFDKKTFVTLAEDAIPILRQLAGLAVKGRGRQGRKYKRIEAEQFDIVVLDPPRWAKSAFGAVDLVRDYQSLFKPALLATRPEGQMLITNNVAEVAFADWLDAVQRCAAKAERPIKSWQLLVPDLDFPSPDERHPLKMLLLSV